MTLLLCTNVLIGQDNRFNVGLLAGLNFSNLEGESITSYFGPNAGVFTSAALSTKTAIGLELLFSQNGEYVAPVFYPNIVDAKIRLKHIEIPVHFDKLIKVSKKEPSRYGSLGIGLAYALLFDYSVENTQGEDITDQIIYDDKDAWLLQANLNYPMTKYLGFNLRASLPLPTNSLEMTLAIRFSYHFRASY